jgi:hypothetical protein
LKNEGRGQIELCKARKSGKVGELGQFICGQISALEGRARKAGEILEIVVRCSQNSQFAKSVDARKRGQGAGIDPQFSDFGETMAEVESRDPIESEIDSREERR